MYALRKDTLAGIKQSALFEARRINPPLKATMLRLNEYMESAQSNASPEGEAIKFYFSNHVFSLIAAKFDQHEPLPVPVAELARNYVKLSGDLVVRLAYYTLLIITREARHFHGPDSVIASIRSQCGKEIGDFCKSICGTHEEGAINMLRSDPPEGTLEAYVRAMVKIFNEGSWGGSYGGPKWGNIAETLRKMVAGEISAEMFADTAFTLAHNGGPIFNKGMLYQNWGSYLNRILDVQSSGQIPQLLDAELKAWEVCDMPFKKYADAARSVFPAETKGYVDWYKVAALAPVRNGHKPAYPKEQAAQLSKYGESKYASMEGIKEAAKLKLAKELDSKKFYVGPGDDDYAVMTERKAA